MKKIVSFILFISMYQFLFAGSAYKSTSILASGNWVKIATTEQGVHKITYDQLIDWGITSPNILRFTAMVDLCYQK